MSTPTDCHAPTPLEPDAVDTTPDDGTMNRELLAEKLVSAYWRRPVSLHDMVPSARADWLAVVDAAIAELHGTPDA